MNLCERKQPVTETLYMVTDMKQCCIFFYKVQSEL